MENNVDILLSELSPTDTAKMLSFRNSIFTPITEAHWKAMGCTASVAKMGDEIVGAIPLQFRQHKINGKVSIPVIFENAVGVSEKARGTGIGTTMLKKAEAFLHDRVDAFFVYRGSERSAGYRFYRKTDHGDLYYDATLVLEKPDAKDNGVEVLPWTAAVDMEKDLLALFNRCYGKLGGYWQRETGYFRRIIESHVYKSDSARLLLARKKEKLLGYAIINPACKKWKGYAVYDMAASNPKIAKQILDKVAHLAGTAQQPVLFPGNCEHPLYRVLTDYGFKLKEDTPYIMAYILRPENIFARLAQGSPLLKTLRLKAVTPLRDLTLNSPAKPACEATLFLKESQLSRLLTCRLDFGSALKTNQIRLSPVSAKIERELGKIFKFSPWVVFGMDYV